MKNPIVEAFLKALGARQETLELSDGGEINIVKEDGRLIIGIQDTFGDDAVISILDQEVEQLRGVLAGLLEEE